MKRVIENGKVAVLVSPNYGAGWFSWHDVEELLFDPVVVEMVRNDRHEEIDSYVARAYPDDNVYTGGALDLMIEWVPMGQRFRINEYDGYESIVLESEEYWLTA
jgi:hypothetical protein